MDITAETRVRDLIREMPQMRDFLVRYDPAFEKLANPVMLRTVGRVATLATAADMAGVPVNQLVLDVRAAAAADAGRQPDGEPVGAERRAEVLKSLIRDLHDGVDSDIVKRRFAELVSEVDAEEIAAMEQALIAEGMPVSEVQRLCDVHVGVFRDSLESAEAPAAPEGHPVDTYRQENEALAAIVESLRCHVEELAGSPSADRQAELLDQVSADLALLAEIDTHYLRKENQLFPLLERHGVAGPTKVMWGIHDEIRERVKAARAYAAAGDVQRLADEMPVTLGAIVDMAYKEEKILFPVSLDTLSAEEWAEMRAGENAIGFAWIEPPLTELAATPRRPETAQGALPLTTGSLTLGQLDLILRRLPVDVTFVDADGRVRYYSEGKRVFPRSPAVIGREVRDCHPPSSAAVVERIVEEFRAGTRDVAEFWIELQGRFVHIEYFALRDDGGTYAGVLEVTQDATHVRGLTGERRLLDWE